MTLTSIILQLLSGNGPDRIQEKDMIIHNTSQGHVIETSNSSRPFRICKGGRTSSFKTLDAAIKAQEKSIKAIHADVKALRESGIDC